MSAAGKRITAGVFYGVSGEILANLISFSGSIIIARLLSPEEYGQIFAVLTLPQLLAGLANLGFGHTIVRFGSWRKWNIAIAMSVTMIGIGSLFTAALLLAPNIVASVLNRPMLADYISIASIYLIALVVSNALTAMLNALGMFQHIALAKITRAITRIATSIALLLIGYGLASVLIGHVLGYGLQAALLLLFTAPQIYLVLRELGGAKIGLESFTKGFSFMIPLIAPNIVSMIISPYLNVLMIKYTDDMLLGNYNVTGIFLTIISFITTMMVQSFVSGFSVTKTKSELDKAFAKSTMYATAIIALAVSPLIFLSQPIVWTLYGPLYIHAPLMVSAASALPLAAAIGSYTVVPYYIAIGDTKRLGIIAIIAAVTSAATGTYLVMNYGVWGNIANNFIANLTFTLTALLVAFKTHGVKINPKPNLRMMAPALISGAAAYLITLSLQGAYGLAALPAYLAIYMLISPFFFREKELQELKSLSSAIKPLKKIMAKTFDIELKIKSLKIYKYKARPHQ